MTMLDRMRRHRNWLKWSLALVCLAFVIFYIPDFLRGTGADVSASDTVAVVQGHDIRADEFRRTYQAQLEAYRQAYGGKMSEQLLKQLGIENQILQQLVDERASVAEAERLGIQVTDEEVRQRILTLPAFQENGAFIGEQRYQLLLRSQRPPLVPAEFEDTVRRSLVIDKLRSSLTQWMSIPDKELETEYRRKNDKVKVAVLAFPVDKYRAEVKVSDDQVASHFDAHKDDFKIPEKRKIRFLLIDLEQLKAKVVVPQADIDRAYNDSIEQYSTPDQVRASHILLKSEGADEAVKAKAADLVKQARAGADFAELAKKYSQDEASAKSGGDLDYFGRGRMVPEFDTAVFAMEPGQISDPVKTQYGYHIIKLIDKKAGAVRTLAEVRPQLNDQLASARAQAQADELAQTLQKEVTKAADLDTVAKARGLQVQESGFFARDEPVLAVGGSPEVAAKAFDMKDGDVSSPIRAPRGYVFATVSGKQASYVPKLDEVKDKVRDALVTNGAKDLAKQAAAAVVAKLKAAPDFDKAAKAAGVEAKTTDFVTRDQPLGDLGVAPDASEAAFALDKGAISDPIAVGNTIAVIKVVDKTTVTPDELASQKDTFREEMLNDERARFFSAYMTKARQKMKIDVNREALQRVVG